jgi:uncharacterized membrane protein YeaQ/YmgE (transglycosylase-associated protein family)
MYFLSWIIVGLVTGRLTGKLLGGGGYGPIVDIVMGIAGAVAGGFIMRLASSPARAGVVYTGFAAILGAAILTGITGYANGARRYAKS